MDTNFKQNAALLRLPPEVHRILVIRNLPYKISGDDLYEIFGQYGAIRQIRRGNAPTTKGTAYVVYNDVYDAKEAFDRLKGFNIGGRYLAISYFKADRAEKLKAVKKSKQDLQNLRKSNN